MTPEAVVVLGSHEWERLPAAADVARRYPRTLVLLTEPVVATPQNCHRCAERIDWLAALQVDRHRVTILPDRVTNTYDEALATAAYCREHAITRLAIVTSPYHTRRALATFQAVFASSTVEFGVVASPPPGWRTAERWWQGSYDRAYVLYEVAAIGWYFVRHGINPIALEQSAHTRSSFELTMQRQALTEVEQL
jgi:uncharacterized SAM-binding protein YcdF (DUF218 family)